MGLAVDDSAINYSVLVDFREWLIQRGRSMIFKEVLRRIVQIAHQRGCELGFMSYSRGLLLFNWIPLGQEERAVKDPLKVLPRAWSSALNVNLDEA